MKRIFALCLALSLCLLPGCGQAPDPSAPLSGEFRQQDNAEYFVETAEGCYYCNPVMQDGKVYFSEKGAHTFYVLCGKPDCSHSDENCNAYVGKALGCCNDKLYGVTQREDGYYQLISMNLDGTNHKNIVRLEELEYTDGTSGGGFEWYFYNGYLFHIVNPIGEGAPCVFFRIDLETGETVRMFDQFSEYNWLGTMFTAYGDCVYTTCSDNRTGTVTLCQGNLETNEWKTLMEWDFNTYGSLGVFEDTLYYYKKGIGMCEYDLKSGEETLKLETTFGIAQVTYDSGHIYVCATDSDWDIEPESKHWNWTFYVYDREYNLLDQLPLEKIGMINPQFQYVASDAIYFSAMSSGKITHYIDPQTIGTGEMELIPVTDPYSAR